jgi:NhaP-type Na+/H+ and K+/H+ antiporter
LYAQEGGLSMTETDVKTLEPAEQNAVQEIYEFLKHGVRPDRETVEAAMEVRQNIVRDTKLLALIRTGQVTASRTYPTHTEEGDRAYVYGYEAHSADAKKFFSSNQKGN